VIANFVDTSKLKPQDKTNHTQRKHFAQRNEKIVIHISNFRSVKRCSDVVKVFARVRQQHPAKLILIGSGPELSMVKNQAEQLGVMDSTWILGQQEAVENLLPLADVLLLTSESESFSLVTLEAMSCAVPTVTTNVGGLSEVVAAQQSGFLDDVCDIESMSKHVLDILKDQELAKKMGQAGRSRAKQLFEQTKIVPQYEKLYERLLSS
jgi:N-acetyl-alpha-D-glucosaminyl L-malate synthase BshA